MSAIAYVTSCFGALSHTFIRSELEEMRRQKVPIYLYGVRSAVSPKLSEADRELITPTRYLYPLNLFAGVARCLSFTLQHPIRTLGTFFSALFNEELHPIQHAKLIYHFVLSVPMAFEMKKQKITHIHAHFFNVPTTLAMYCAMLLDCGYSFTNHTGNPTRLPDMIGLRQKLRLAQRVFTISRQSASCLDQIEACAHKISVVHCGIDPTGYPFSVHRKGSWKGRPVRLLCVGRMVDFKGFSFAVETLRVLQHEGDDYTLSFVGEGPLLESVKQQVEQTGLQSAVTFFGALSSDEVRKAMETHDLLLVPSITTKVGKMEGLPVVIMEAMALGLPVVATRSAGIPEIVLHEQTGLLSESEDSSGMAANVVRMVTDHELRGRCLSEAANLVALEFDIRKISVEKAMMMVGLSHD